jgi:SAM-dependent methyltransferase
MESAYRQSRYTFDEGRSAVWRAIVNWLRPFIVREGITVDLGCGYCDFINNVQSERRVAIDLDEGGGKFCAPGVTFFQGSITDLSMLADGTVSTFFASNLFEHLDDGQLSEAVREIARVAKPGGRLILLQPNYRYAYREYFDDFTHKKVFSHVSLPDFLLANGFEIERVIPRFLPFSMKSRLPKSYLLTRLYLASPLRPMAKQMLVICRTRR